MSHDPNAPELTTHVSQREMSDGAADGLQPLSSLDVSKIGDFDEMLQAMSLTAFGGRRMGEAAEVLEAMVTDPDCSVVLTLSGAMTVAKMGLVITEMVERGWVQAIVSTGALMTHGLVELTGMTHYKAISTLDDEALFKKGYNRVYDTYEMEQNLNQLQRLLKGAFLALRARQERFGSRDICEEIGRTLCKPGVRGIMASCYRKGVPIYIPAFSDSELGLDTATWLIEDEMRKRGTDKIKSILSNLQSPFDPFMDLGHYTRIVTDSPRLGIFTIGGGVPRNWAQQAPPFIDIINTAVHTRAPLNRFRYGLRICPEPVHWGGLSGCTYSEGVSWGKFVPESEGGRFAEVHSDATIAWPIVVKAVAQRLDKKQRQASSPRLSLAGCQPK